MSKELEKAAKEPIFIKVGDEIKEIDRDMLAEELFEVEFEYYKVQIANDNGNFFVSNAVDGWGTNRKKDFQNTPVTFLTQLPKEYWQVQGLEDRIFAMDNAIGCLALELHEDIWNDVNKRWQLLKQQLSTPPSSDKASSRIVFTCKHCCRIFLKRTAHKCNNTWNKGQKDSFNEYPAYIASSDKVKEK